MGTGAVQLCSLEEQIFFPLFVLDPDVSDEHSDLGNRPHLILASQELP